MILRGITVIEMAGLAPAPYCATMLSDFGARVIRIDKPGTSWTMDRGKQSVMIDLKKESSVPILKKLCKTADIFLESFRPGVMERYGLGPQSLMKENPRLIYARLTGYGQTGDMAQMAGHDINYIATSGILSKLGWGKERPTPASNLLADFAGGGLMCAFGIILALLERSSSGIGQVIDANMVQGSAYLDAWGDAAKNFLHGGDKGTNLLDGGKAYYDTYKTKDGKYMAVGAFEPKFYECLIKGLGLDSNHSQSDDQANQRRIFKEVFLTKTREEWTNIFANLDACVTPVLTTEEAAELPHNKAKATFLKVSRPGEGTTVQAGPAPLFSRTPADTSRLTETPVHGEHTRQVLEEYGYTQKEIGDFLIQKVVQQSSKM